MVPYEKIVESAKRHFPYDKPNAGQLESIVEAVNYFMNEDIKHVIIQAPTGIGKTAIATTVHRVMDELSGALHRSTIVTITKSLQDQYRGADAEIIDIKGKTNYGCLYGHSHYGSPSCRVHVSKGLCRASRECPYIITRDKWCKSTYRMSNSSFVVSAPLQLQGGSSLMILDECHELEDKITDHATLVLNPFKYDNFKDLDKFGMPEIIKSTIDKIKSYTEIGVAYEICQEIKDMAADLTGSLVYHIELFNEIAKSNTELTEREFNYIDTLATDLNYFQLLRVNNGLWINEVNQDGMSDKILMIKPVFAFQVSDVALFDKAKSFLHMSATICGADVYASQLGIKENEYKYIEVANPIPVERRRVYASMPVNVGSKSTDKDYEKLAEEVDKIMDKFTDKNGIIHTVSYALATKIYGLSKHKDRMVVSKNKLEIMEVLKKRKGVFVLSPSISTGMDFKYDLARINILVKVPYLYLGSTLVKLNADHNQNWYSRKAVLTMIQACGRTTRGVDDASATFILDSNFKRLYGMANRFIPQWFKDSIVWP